MNPSNDGAEVLHFLWRLGDTEGEGVDMMRFDGDGLIEDYRVMVRPLSAVGAARCCVLSAAGTVVAGQPFRTKCVHSSSWVDRAREDFWAAGLRDPVRARLTTAISEWGGRDRAELPKHLLHRQCEYDFDIAMAVCLLQSPCFWKNVFRQQFEPFCVVQASPLQHYFIGASIGILPNLLYQFLSGPNKGVE